MLSFEEGAVFEMCILAHEVPEQSARLPVYPVWDACGMAVITPHGWVRARVTPV